ncbi:hypothetical protein Tco_0696040 [Tanacetum coccineum]
MPWRHPDSCITNRVPTHYNQKHVDRLKAHVVKLCDIPEGVLVRSGVSRVWHNMMCDPVLRHSNNTVMSIYDFLCMPSLDMVKVREEPHGLDTSILDRVADHTTSPAPAGTVIPHASPEEIAVTRPGRKVVTKADNAAKQKTSTGPEISTNATKKTRSSKKGSGAGSSGQSVGDGVKQVDDGTLDDDDRREDTEFSMEGIENLNDVSQDKEVEPHVELSRGVRRTTRASFRVSHGISEDASPRAQEVALAPNVQSQDANDGGNDSDGSVDPYHEARVGNTAGDVLERDLLPLEEIHVVNLGLRKKELYKDPKVYRTALDRFPTPAETCRLREPSSFELSDRMSVLQCQLITYRSMLNARYDHSLKNVDRLTKRCSLQTQIIKKQNADIRQQSESIVRANEELEHHERQAEETQGSVASFFQSNFTPLVRRFLKSGEFNRAFTGVLNMEISVGVERGLHMDRTDEEFKDLSRRFYGFIPNAQEKFDGAVAAFSTTTSPSWTRYLKTQRAPCKTLLDLSLTGTPYHLKKKKKSVEIGGPSAV